MIVRLFRFREMETHNYVENSFWNFDTLFQPQKHPARDMHDTFFLSDPANSDVPEGNYWQQVRDVHMRGYQSDWDVRESQKNVLRTHTTAVTARTLFNLAGKEFRPSKFFSIDRVFRNETLDATHLAEFHQIEGCVIDYDMSLADLIGLVTVFFNKLGCLHFCNGRDH
ncbi:phenylalanine--tRNA ligase alpha subunit-like [Octopus sinensis]|uniref:Phenylalanine--tRNA ligase alpha subunit-like n=1 Tax=Octopus sinensis TaxID=2607531 RepID=A0A7E6EG16_9MOLL|nr:phenylalanine--tRNA ligase alpha subunit-like [Octopus sinensis]